MHRLEDKFDGIELNHIACKYNEEADQLSKITSVRTTVPPNVFSRDLAKPSVDFKNPAKAVGAAPGPSGAATTVTAQGLLGWANLVCYCSSKGFRVLQ